MISIFHIFEISINIENTFKKYFSFPVFKKKFSFNYRISRFFLSFRRLSFLITSPLERNFCAFSQMNFPLLILYVGYVSLLLKATNVELWMWDQLVATRLDAKQHWSISKCQKHVPTPDRKLFFANMGNVLLVLS